MPCAILVVLVAILPPRAHQLLPLIQQLDFCSPDLLRLVLVYILDVRLRGPLVLSRLAFRVPECIGSLLRLCAGFLCVFLRLLCSAHGH